MSAAGTPDATRRPTVTGIRLAAVSMLLLGLAFVQDPGFLVSDTKFDLAQAPGAFLARALHLWDGLGAFGQLQNQAYGYLWPMGPFFWLGSLLDVPGWAVQRLWLGLVLVVAFVGCARVARSLGVRSDIACIVAGLAYALSPRMLTTLGPISIEAWPSALAPWVLLPLVRGASAGSARRAAALSAAAVAMVGGVNAAATFAVLPLGMVWLLTRTPGPRRRTLLVWWPVFTALGTLWWLVPLFLMGKYSPPFLDFIESSSITTFPTTLFDSLRGTSDWVPYVDGSWRAGNDLITKFYLPLNSGVVLFFGFVGLMLPRNPHRQFLVLSLVTGLALVTLGHTGAVQGWFATDLHHLLDGPLAPLRNVHKFDPILRLPLVIGLAWLIDSMVRARTTAPAHDARSSALTSLLGRSNQLTVVALAVFAVLGAALPALSGRIGPAGATVAVPDYWRQTASWLARDSGDGVALLVPGSGFADYVWGSPRDEPLQFLSTSRWAVRNAIPLAPAGNIRMLDAVEERFAQGLGSTGLADYLRRAGVRYLVVRNDLTRSDDVPDPVLVHQALAASPGIARVRSFGPVVGGDGHLEQGARRIVVNGGWQAAYPAVEVYQVSGGGAPVVSSATQPLVVGGPEDLLGLSDLGVLGLEPTRLAVDGAQRTGPAQPLVLTDGLRARERFFGRTHDATSPTLTPGDVPRSRNPTRDYLLGRDDRWSTRVRLTGVEAVSASSSMADSSTAGGVRPDQSPFAALDGSPRTAWVSGLGQDDRASWRVTYDAPTAAGSVTLTGGGTADPGQVVRVRTQHGVSEPVVLGPGRLRTVPLPAGRSAWLSVEDASHVAGTQITLAEVRVPGVTARRALVLPRLPAAWGTPGTIVLRRAGDARTGCVDVGADTRCVAGRARSGEESQGMSRVVRLRSAARYRPALTVSPRAGARSEALLEQSQPLNVSASSAPIPDLRASPLAAVDGDPGTTWSASVDDVQPTLRLDWLGERRVTGMVVSLDRDAAARRPEVVILTWPHGHRRVTLDGNGRARFPAIRTDQLAIRVEQAEDVTNLGFDRSQAQVPVGVSELRLRGVPYLPLRLPTTPVDYPCGTGPRVDVDGHAYRTSVRAAPADLLRMLPAPAQVCGGGSVDLAAGDNPVDVMDSAAFAADAMVLTTGGVSVPPVVHQHSLVSSTPVRRVVVPTQGDDLTTFRENTNPGWRARQDGRDLAPVVMDGWQQGFLSHPDGGAVTEWFAPDRPYRWGLGVGAGTFLLLMAAVAVPGRRWPGRSQPPVRVRTVPPAFLLTVGLLAGGLLAGWIGLAVTLAGLALAWSLGRRVPQAAPWALGACCLVAAAAYTLHPWGDSAGWAGSDRWPAYVMLLPVAGAVATAAAGVRRPRFFRLIAGRSTRR